MRDSRPHHRTKELPLDPSLGAHDWSRDDTSSMRAVGVALLIVTLAIGAVILLWAKPWVG